MGRAAGHPLLHALPGARRHLRRGGRAGRSLLGVLPRHRAPSPAPGGKVLVFGAGALGLASVAILRALYPGVEVAVVARFPAQAAKAREFGASAVFAHEPRLALVEGLAEWSGGVLHSALDGLPMAHPGHIDVVYDSVAKPETFEVGVRVLAERGRLVYTGVAVPGTVGVDTRLLQGADHRGLQRLRHGGVRRGPPARHRALPGPGPGRSDRPDHHGHPPLPPRGLVGTRSRPWPGRRTAAS